MSANGELIEQIGQLLARVDDGPSYRQHAARLFDELAEMSDIELAQLGKAAEASPDAFRGPLAANAPSAQAAYRIMGTNGVYRSFCELASVPGGARKLMCKAIARYIRTSRGAIPHASEL